MTRIHFIGGEKGGVGKSVLSRLLAQYYIDRGRPFHAFDADLLHGALMRYYGEFSKPVDFSNYDSADILAEAAVETGHDVIVDLAAQASLNLDKWMSESGVIELCQELEITVTLWHVMDDATDAIRLLGRALKAYGIGPQYMLVRNHGRGEDFSLFNSSKEKAIALKAGAKVMDLPALHPNAMRKIDRIGASLWAAANNSDEAIGPVLGLLERQRVKVWLSKTYSEFDRLLPESEQSAEAELPIVEAETDVVN